MQVELQVLNVATQILSAQRLQWWRAEPIRPPAGPALVVNGLTGCQAQPGCRFRTSVNAVQWVKGTDVRSYVCLLGIALKQRGQCHCHPEPQPCCGVQFQPP